MHPPSSRFEWIDLLRGIAVVGMIWTHVANTFLPAEVQATAFYHSLSFYHGLVAPTFFWVAGYMRGVSAARPGLRKPAWPTVKRLLMIWFIGYLLHMPWEALTSGQWSADALRILFQSDVLHCLALSSLLLFGVERGLHERPVPAWVIAGLVGLTVVLLTDSMATVATGFMPLDGYLSKASGSLFPVFPWVGFACAGFVSGSFGLPGLRTLLAGVLLALILPQVPGFWGTVPFFFERLGWVLMVAAALANGARWIAYAPRWLMLAGRESLSLYVVHLLIIYAVPWWGGRTLSMAIGPTQSWPQIGGWFVVVMVLSLLTAWLNERRKLLRRAS